MRTRLRQFFGCLLILLIPLIQAPTAEADVPILYGRVEIASGDTPVTLLVVPDGSGPALTEVRSESGQVLDGTITFTLLDAEYNPIFLFPAEDIWLESWDDDMNLCPAGANPDGSTDINGQTTWTQPLHAGGWSEAQTAVLVGGAIMTYETQAATVNLQINSPDINGDRVVDLRDLAEFASDFHTGYHFRSDLCRDGELNLLDVVVLAEAWGAACP